MWPSRLLCMVSCMCAVPAVLSAQPNDADLQFRLGVAFVSDSATLCFATESRTLSPGDSITLVSAPVPGAPGFGRVIPAAIGTAGVICGADSTAAQGFGDFTYALRSNQKPTEPGELYIGVVAAAHQFHARGRDVVANLGPRWPALGFRACTSEEGLHLTVWAGQPLKAQRLWHWYVHFDYSTQVTCEDADY